MTGRLYVATADGRGCKIGRSADPVSRMAGVAAENGCRVSLIAATDPLEADDQAEALAHWLLRDQHLGGEWFAVSTDTAVEVMFAAVRSAEDGETAPRRINNATPFHALKDVRVQLVISPSEIEALDEWRAKKRIWSRSEAIRQLIAEGVKRGENKP